MDKRCTPRGDAGLSGRRWLLYRRWARLGSLWLCGWRRLWGVPLAAHPEVHAVVGLGPQPRLLEHSTPLHPDTPG